MNNQKYKIVYCTPALYSAGGVERVVTVKANYFADVLGYDVTIIVTEGEGCESFFPLSENVHVRNLGIRFEELWNVPFFKKVVLYINKQRNYKKLLTTALLDIRPDITISTLRREINFISSINDGSIKIGELHLNRTHFRELENHRYNFVISMFSKWWKGNLVNHLKRLDRFVVLTEASIAEWPELRHVVHIPDPVPIHPNTVCMLHTKRIITIGRYSYEKGYDLLLKAWSIVEKQFPDWHLEIFGMGDITPYKQMAEELGIDEDRCHFNGSVEDVVNEYLNSSIFVLSSRFEGFGLVLVESMACGVPVLSFACKSGPVELISDGVDGLLVPVGNVQAFADKLVQLMSDSDLQQRLAKNGLEKVKKYSIEKVAGQWKLLFDELVQANEV